MSESEFWASFWDGKAAENTDFQATGRSQMDIIGFLNLMRDVSLALALNSGDNLIDAGCGSGILALALSPQVASIRGFDISSRMVERARRNLANVANCSFAEGSIVGLPLPDGSGDKFLAYSVLQYLDGEAGVEAALREAYRVLRPGGIGFLAANPDPDRKTAFIERMNAHADEAHRRLNMDLLGKLAWVPPVRMVEIARKVGFEAEARPLSPAIWQHFYMFDLWVRKNG